MQVTFEDHNAGRYDTYMFGDKLTCLGWWVDEECRWEHVLAWNLVLGCLLSAAATCAIEKVL